MVCSAVASSVSRVGQYAVRNRVTSGYAAPKRAARSFANATVCRPLGDGDADEAE